MVHYSRFYLPRPWIALLELGSIMSSIISHDNTPFTTDDEHERQQPCIESCRWERAVSSKFLPGRKQILVNKYACCASYLVPGGYLYESAYKSTTRRINRPYNIAKTQQQLAEAAAS